MEERPKATARDTRRQAILAVAREVFMQDGYAAASMSAIAARAGGSKGTLYNYFPSKEELFCAVIQDECDLKQAALFDDLQGDGEDVAEVLRAVGRRYMSTVLSERTIAFTRAVIAESSRFPELGRVMNEAGPRRGRERLAVYVKQQMDTGRLRRDDPDLAVEQFCDMCLGRFYRQRLMNVTGPPSEAEIAANVEGAVGVMLAAYGPSGAVDACQASSASADSSRQPAL